MNLSWLIPFRRIVLETTLSPEEAANALRPQVGDPSWTAMLGFSTGETPAYLGSVELGDFRLTRNLRYRNSFQPVVEGKIEPTAYGSRITVRMRLMVPVLLFMAFWMIGASVGAVSVVLSTIRGPGGIGPQLLVLLMPVFGIALTSGGFGFEASKSERFLRELFPPATALRKLGPYRDRGE